VPPIDDVAAAKAKAKQFENTTLQDAAVKNQVFVDAAEEEGGQRVASPGWEKRTNAIMDVLEKGDLDPRSALGQAFADHLKKHPEESEKYKALREPGMTMMLKKQFRLKWCESELEKITVAKVKLEEYQLIDEDDGTYQCFENIVIGEGGKDSPDAWSAATNYVTATMELGGKWLTYNCMTKRTDILYIQKNTEPFSTGSGACMRRASRRLRRRSFNKKRAK